MTQKLFTLFFALLALSACTPSTSPLLPSPTRRGDGGEVTFTPQPTATPLPSATPTLPPTATSTPLPTATATATHTPTKTPLPPAEIVGGALILRDATGKTKTLDVPQGATLGDAGGKVILVEGKTFDRTTVATAKQGNIETWVDRADPNHVILAETPKNLTWDDLPALQMGVNVDLTKPWGGNTGIVFNTYFWEIGKIAQATALTPLIPGKDKINLVKDVRGDFQIQLSLANSQGEVTKGKDLFIPIFKSSITGETLIHYQSDGNVILPAEAQRVLSLPDFVGNSILQLYFVRNHKSNDRIEVGVQINKGYGVKSFEEIMVLGNMPWRVLVR